MNSQAILKENAPKGRAEKAQVLSLSVLAAGDRNRLREIGYFATAMKEVLDSGKLHSAAAQRAGAALSYLQEFPEPDFIKDMLERTFSHAHSDLLGQEVSIRDFMLNAANFELLGRLVFAAELIKEDQLLAAELTAARRTTGRFDRSLTERLQGFVSRSILGPDSPFSELLNREFVHENSTEETFLLAGVLGLLFDCKRSGPVARLLKPFVPLDTEWKSMNRLHPEGLEKEEINFLKKRREAFHHARQMKEEARHKEESRAEKELELKKAAIEAQSAEQTAKTGQAMAEAARVSAEAEIAKAQAAKKTAEAELKMAAAKALEQKATADLASAEAAKARLVHEVAALNTSALKAVVEFHRLKNGQLPSGVTPEKLRPPRADELLGADPVQVLKDGTIRIATRPGVAKFEQLKTRDMRWMQSDRSGYMSARAAWRAQYALAQRSGYRIKLPPAIGQDLFMHNEIPRDWFSTHRDGEMLVTIPPGALTFNEHGWGSSSFKVGYDFINESIRQDEAAFSIFMAAVEYFNANRVARVP